MNGTVFLVGAGPGDPKLLTRRGLELLQECDCIVYDALIGQELLGLARPDAELHFVGKRSGQHSQTQDEINALLVRLAQDGKSVCRLKGGDPFVFGRGGEEALFCAQNEVPFGIVPGVTSSIAAPAYAGIPVTHRDLASSFAVVTGHTASDDAPPDSLPVADTLVFLMGIKALPLIVKRLLERGTSPDKPVAVVRWGTTSDQQTVVGTLQTIEEEVKRANLKTPALIVVGEVVRLREELRWFDTRPLWGQTVVVTRAREQASSLVTELETLGASVVQCPTIRVEPLPETIVLDEELPRLMRNEWIVFTSVNGVEFFWRKLRDAGLDARALGATQVAAIGPATKNALLRHGIAPDYVPESSVSEAVAVGLLERGAGGQRLLIVRALEGREALETRLMEGGARVVIAPLYRTMPDVSKADEVRDKMARGEINWVSFTSSSTVLGFLEAVGREFVLEHRASFGVAVIGPITAKTARENGLVPDVEAQSAGVEALAQAIREARK
jgi:uroporphyrinogen III methyltransferase/synthase